MSVIAIIPARAGSKGIPHKNFTRLCGVSPVDRAIMTAASGVGISRIVVSTDADLTLIGVSYPAELLRRPPELAQDDTPMIAVVQHVLERIPGPSDQIIVLLQPTQPLRTPADVRAAIGLLEAHPQGTVVSVVPTESIDKVCTRIQWELTPCGFHVEQRQVARPTFKRDGTVYAWRRGEPFMGHPWIALDINPRESCPLDTAADWLEAERRLTARNAVS